MFSQVFYILSEDPSKSITQCINESVNLMKGHKWELFYLGSFLLVAKSNKNLHKPTDITPLNSNTTKSKE